MGQLLRALADLEAVGGSLLPDLLARAFAVGRPAQPADRGLGLPRAHARRSRSAFERARFEGHECLCLQVLDADELDFPFTGAHVFEDPETGERRRFVGEEARLRYRERLEHFLREYRDLWVRLQVRNVLIRTDEEPGAALARGLSEAPLTFLSPWLLVGAAALGVPLWLHLRARTGDVTLFPALRFLEDQPRPRARGFRVRDAAAPRAPPAGAAAGWWPRSRGPPAAGPS